MRNLFYGIGTLIGLLIIAFVLLRSPDTDPRAMAQKYGGTKLQRICYGNGNCIHIRENGNADGPALILLHGSNDSLHVWEPVIPFLEDDYRILTLDLPGHGLSGPHINHDYSAPAMIEAVQALARHADLTDYTIGGNSMGGWIAWRYALAYPDEVTHLLLLNASGAPLPDNATKPPLNIGFRLIQNPLIRPLLRHITPKFMVRKSILQTVVDPDIVTDDLVTRYWELLRYPGNREATIRRTLIDREPGMAEKLNEISQPTLILWGEQDQLVPVDRAYAFEQILPDSKLVIFEQTGHLPMLERPKDTADAIAQFLEERKFAESHNSAGTP